MARATNNITTPVDTIVTDGKHVAGDASAKAALSDIETALQGLVNVSTSTPAPSPTGEKKQTYVQWTIEHNAALMREREIRAAKRGVGSKPALRLRVATHRDFWTHSILYTANPNIG